MNSNILAGGRKMTTMKVELQLSSDDLLKAVEQLSQADLKQFISQVIALQAQRTAPSLMQQESELLLKINQVISVEIQNYYNDLIAKRDTETLTDEEHRELLSLTEQIEKQQAQRIEYLVELANLRGISLNALMESLGIQMQVYV
ncbi:STAS/SEC14 domain-containing protein [Nodularia spumigena]|uniref:STAS/SEC14 domain-containing protein n=3 Tax=Nodularia spumigena TaxID=70799 RepID=UPI001E3E026F|nr:STAS/SEC14 domain-containing protein [Nodularia spumigena]